METWFSFVFGCMLLLNLSGMPLLWYSHQTGESTSSAVRHFGATPLECCCCKVKILLLWLREPCLQLGRSIESSMLRGQGTCKRKP